MTKNLSANNIDIWLISCHIFTQAKENNKKTLEENMARIQSWEVSDAFWGKVEPLIPTPERDPNKTFKRRAGGGRKPIPPRKIFEAILYVLRTGCQ